MAEDAGGGGEKTEQATPKRREKAREEGQVGKSMEVPSVAVLFAGIISLYFFTYYIYQNLTDIMRYSFVFQSIPNVNIQYCIGLLYGLSQKLFFILLPVMLVVFLVAIASNFFQVGFEISWKAIAPKFSKINFIQGFARIFSARSLFELLKSILKLLIIAIISYYAVKGELVNILRLYDNSIGYIFLFILKISYKIFIRVLLLMILLALIDLFYQRWQFEEQLKMTKQEVKEEYKQTEGDPQIKARIRRVQMQAAKKRMMAEVPKADVVVTNPTHLAIAIKYDPITMQAPKVIAKGSGTVAERIKSIAQKFDIPIIENKELARGLYKMVEIENYVPEDFYVAVAELLAYVYKLKGKKGNL